MDLVARKARLEAEQERVATIEAAQEDLPKAEEAVAYAEQVVADVRGTLKAALSELTTARWHLSQRKQLLGIRVRPKPEAPPATEKPARAKRGAKGEVPGEAAAETAAGAIDEE